MHEKELSNHGQNMAMKENEGVKISRCIRQSGQDANYHRFESQFVNLR